MNANTRLVRDRTNVLTASTNDKRTQRCRNQHRERHAFSQLQRQFPLRFEHSCFRRPLDDEHGVARFARRASLDLHRSTLLLHALEECAELQLLLVREAQGHGRLMRHSLEHRRNASCRMRGRSQRRPRAAAASCSLAWPPSRTALGMRYAKRGKHVFGRALKKK